MDQEMIAYFDKRFGELRKEIVELCGEIGKLREETSQRFEEVRNKGRLPCVSEQGIRSEVRLVAQGVMGIFERLEAHQSAALLKFDEVKAFIIPYYQDLNRRIGILEGRADRQTRDVIDVIREKFGKA